MGQDRDARVRMRAHEIWERENRPDGGADQHRLQAEEELRAAEAGLAAAADSAQPAAAEGAQDEPARKPTGTGTVATGTVVDPDLAGTSR